jgi:serine/threonine-protein kinase
MRGATVSDLAPGTVRFTVVRRLGTGGFGTVDLVRITESRSVHMPVGQLLARKQLSKKWEKNARALARFEREVEQMRQMNHPRIVPLASGLFGRSYLMPAYEQSLRASLRKRKTYPTADVLAFIADIADALHHAHSLGFVHRDIKPENILLNEAGFAHVADWGIGGFAHKQSRVLTRTVGKLGTSHYASAEQWATGAGTVQSDIYSLGMVLGEILAKKPARIRTPGIGIRVRVLKKKSPATDAVCLFVQQMTSLLPSGRPQSMAVVRDKLRELEAAFRKP